MGVFANHLYGGTYPYLTPADFIQRCSAASGALEDDDAVIDAVTDASLIMYYLTGRQFNGVKQTTVTPENWDQSCGPYKLNLGLWPITEIVAIREDGVDQDVADYHVDEYRYIVKNNGAAFPRRSNWYAASGDADDAETSDGGYVFEITVEHGIPAPRLLKRATQALACQLYHDANGNDCDLPQRVTNVTRNGLTMEVADFQSLLNSGSIGIYEVDLAVQVLNPTRMQSPSFVWTPDMYRGITRHT